MDGTYIYIQKSQNYRFQRRCFSMHKNRPLVKPMVVTTTDGYILSILGPYFSDGKNNDASILTHALQTNEDGIRTWMKEGDIFILDRGFRDAIDFLEENGFQTEYPSFLKKSDKQLNTEDANASRLVTKIRWAVESVNGRLKQFKYFDKVVPNVDISNIKHNLHIVAALCNKYKPPLRKSSDEDCKIAEQMLQKAKQPNNLQQRILTDKRLQKRSKSWKPLDDNTAAAEFPKLSESYIRSITFGIYQLKQCPNYADQHLSEGDMNIRVSTVARGLLQATIQSRHTGSKLYSLWIQYDECATSMEDQIQEWYCECKVGARTVGCCAHIATVLWYLGYARHNNYSVSSRKEKMMNCLKDAKWENLE